MSYQAYTDAVLKHFIKTGEWWGQSRRRDVDIPSTTSVDYYNKLFANQRAKINKSNEGIGKVAPAVQDVSYTVYATSAPIHSGWIYPQSKSEPECNSSKQQEEREEKQEKGAKESQYRLLDGSVRMKKEAILQHFIKTGEWLGPSKKKVVEEVSPATIENENESSEKEEEKGDESVEMVQMDNNEGPKTTTQDLVFKNEEHHETSIETSNIINRNLQLEEDEDKVVMKLASTAEIFSVDQVTNRWMPMETIEVNTSMVASTLIKCYAIPRDVYKLADKSPSLMAFRNFVYGQFDFKIRFIMNSTKFHAGKLLIALKYDPYGYDATHVSINAALARPHVILDCSCNNEAELEIPYKFRRAVTHVRDGLSGTNSAQFANVHVYILSPLVNGVGVSTTVRMRAMAMMTRADFSGISYALDVQMLNPFSLADRIKAAERSIMYGKKAIFGDKPSDLSATVVTPRPRLNFMGSRGLSDAIPMRSTLTGATKWYRDNVFEYEPDSIIELAQIEGVKFRLHWKTGDLPDAHLGSFIPDPTGAMSTIDDTPTMLEYVCGMFGFWHGDIELEIMFVCTQFHTGSILVNVSFDRNAGDIEEKASTYSKVIDVDSVSRHNFRIPFVYSTLMARNSLGAGVSVYDRGSASEETKKIQLSLLHLLRTEVSFTVVNQLVAPESVSSDIEIVIFWRAGANFKVEQLISSNWRHYLNDQINSFPKDFQFGNAVKARLNLQQLNHFAQIKHPQKVQMIETIEINHIIDILRRPVLLIYNYNILRNINDGNTTTFALPVMPPSRNFCMDMSYKNPEIFQAALVTTPHVAITNLYRYWRGSMRYTIIVYDTSYPVYVTYIPRGGARQLGLGAWSNNNDKMIGDLGAGYITEMIIPQVNPTVSIEVPFGSENTWNLVSEDSTKSNYSWRDKGDLSAGTLLISSVSSFRFDLWWAAGDDFKLANLYGPPKCINDKVEYSYRDDRADIPQVNLKRRVTSVKKNIPRPAGRVQMGPMEMGMEFLGESAMGLIGNLTDKIGSNMTATFGVAAVAGGTVLGKKAYDTMKSVDRRSEELIVEAVKARESLDQNMSGVNAKLIGTTEELLSETVRTREMLQENVTLANRNFTTAAQHITTKIDETSADLIEQIRRVAEGMTGVTDKVGEGMSTINEMLESVKNSREKYDSYAGVWTSIAINIALEFVQNIISGSWSNMIFSITRILTPIFSTSVLKNVTEKLKQIYNWIKEMVDRACGKKKQETSTVIQTVQAAGNEYVICGTIASLVCMFLNITITGKDNKYKSFFMEALSRFTSMRAPSYVMATIRLVSYLMESIKSFVMYLFGYVDPEAKALEIMMRQESGYADFLNDAFVIMDQNNANLLNIPSFRVRYWFTVMRAKNILRLMAESGNKIVSPVLSRVCFDVIKIANEKSVDMRSCPVRYEPFVICIEGSPGIGKSFLTESVVDHLFEASGHKFMGVEKIFYKNAVAQFWSNFAGQPCIVIDEFCNIISEQKIVDQLDDLFHLKSTSSFTPPMAALSEKNIKANPLIVIMLCNNAFPLNELEKYTMSPEAVLRRRDVVVNVRLAEEFADVVDIRSEIDRGVLEDKQHLRFAFYKDAKKRDSLGKYESWNSFIQQLEGKWIRWNEQEELNVKARMTSLCKSLGNGEDAELIGSDPFRYFYGVEGRVIRECNQNSFMPSEVVEFETRRCLENLLSMERERVQKSQNAQMDIILWGQCFVSAYLAARTLRESGLNMLFPAFQIDKCKLCLKISYIAHTCSRDHRVCGSCVLHFPDQLTKLCYKSDCMRIQSPMEDEIREHPEKYASMLAFMMNYFSEKCSLSDEKWKKWENASGVMLISGFLAVVARIMLGTADFENYGDAFAYSANGIWFAYFKWVHPEVKKLEYVQTDEPEVYKPELISFDQFKAILDKKGEAEVEFCSHARLTDKLLDDMTYSIDAGVVPISFKRKMDEEFGFWTLSIRPGADPRFVMSERYCKGNCALRRNLERFYDLVVRWYFNKYAFLTMKKLQEDDDLTMRQLLPLELMPPKYVVYKEVMEEMKGFKSKLWRAYEYLMSQFRKFRMVFGFVLAATIFLKSVVKMVRGFFNTAYQEEEVNVFDDDSDIEETQGRSNYQRETIPFGTPKKVRIRARVQGGQANELMEIVKNKIRRNTIRINCFVEGNMVTHYATGICGHYAMMPKHYYEYYYKNSYREMEINIKQLATEMEYRYIFSTQDFIISRNSDLCLMRLPRTFQQFKDIRHFFICDDRITSPIPSKGILYLVPMKHSNGFQEQLVEIQGLEQKIIINNPYISKQSSCVDTVRYGYSAMGACGSFLFLDESRPLIAMHVSGTGQGVHGSGSGVLITQEMIGELMELEPPVLERMDPDCAIPVDEAQFALPQAMDVELISGIPKEMKVYIPTKSNIRPSLVTSVDSEWVSFTQPAILTESDPRYGFEVGPLTAGVMDHGRPTKNFRTDLVEKAKLALWERYYEYAKPVIVQPRKLTIEESILGIPGIEGYEHIKLDTSAGWPWTMMGKSKNKKDFIHFGVDDQNMPISVEFIDEKLKERVIMNEELRKKGSVPSVVFVDTLKDERRKPNKIVKFGGTRIFCASPLDYTIELRRSFLHFMAMFRVGRIQQPHGIGINVDSPEWTDLAMRLNTCNTNGIFTFDYSNYGATLNSEVLSAAFDIMIEWTLKNVKGVDETEMHTLAENMISSDHLIGDLVYRQKCGSPSGSPLTDVINSLVNMLYLMIAWKILTQKDFDDFFQNVVFFVYGDDVIASVSDDFKEQYNAETISKCFAGYGITGTDASKAEQVKPYGTLLEASFLKRGFLLVEEFTRYYLAPLEEYVVNDVPLWIWKCPNEREATLENCRQGLLLCFGRGPGEFYRLKRKINSCLAKLKIPPITLTWDEIYSLHFPNG